VDNRGLIPGLGRDMSPGHRIQTCSGAHSPSNPVRTVVHCSPGQEYWTVELITHLQLVSLLRICGNLLPLPHYSFMA